MAFRPFRLKELLEHEASGRHQTDPVAEGSVVLDVRSDAVLVLLDIAATVEVRAFATRPPGSIGGVREMPNGSGG